MCSTPCLTRSPYKENIEAIKGKIKESDVLSGHGVAVAILVTAILLIFVVPQLKMCSDFGAQPPLSPR